MGARAWRLRNDDRLRLPGGPPRDPRGARGGRPRSGRPHLRSLPPADRFRGPADRRAGDPEGDPRAPRRDRLRGNSRSERAAGRADPRAARRASSAGSGSRRRSSATSRQPDDAREDTMDLGSDRSYRARRRGIVGSRPGVGRRPSPPRAAGSRSGRAARPVSTKSPADLRQRHGADVTVLLGDAAEPGTGAPDRGRRAGQRSARSTSCPQRRRPSAGRPDGDRRRRLDAAPSSCSRSRRSSWPRRCCRACASEAGDGSWGSCRRACASRSPTSSTRTPARGALAAWLKTTARSVAADGVTVNGVLPGRLQTPAHRQPRPRPERSGRASRWTPCARPTGNHPGGALRAARGARARASPTSARSRPPTRPGTFTAIDGGLIAGLP